MEEELFIAVDADCPNPKCRFPERRFSPRTGKFSCKKCDYASRERER